MQKIVKPEFELRQTKESTINAQLDPSKYDGRQRTTTDDGMDGQSDGWDRRTADDNNDDDGRTVRNF